MTAAYLSVSFANSSSIQSVKARQRRKLWLAKLSAPYASAASEADTADSLQVRIEKHYRGSWGLLMNGQDLQSLME